MLDENVKAALGKLEENGLEERLMETLRQEPLRCPPIENKRHRDLNGDGMPYVSTDFRELEVEQALDPVAYIDGMFDELVQEFRAEVGRSSEGCGRTVADSAEYEPEVIVTTPREFGIPSHGGWRVGIKWNVNFKQAEPGTTLSVPWIRSG